MSFQSLVNFQILQLRNGCVNSIQTEGDAIIDTGFGIELPYQVFNQTHLMFIEALTGKVLSMTTPLRFPGLVDSTKINIL